MTYGLHIAGATVETERTYETLNPYTGEPWATVADASAGDVDAAVRAARDALEGPWGAMTAPERAAVLRSIADGLEAEADRLARLESTDNGKLLRETAGQMAAIPSLVQLLRGRRRDRTGRHDPDGQAELPRLHRAGAGRRRRRDRAVELATAAAGVETRARIRCRLHDGGQAVRPHAGDDGRVRPLSRARRAARGRA